MAGFTYKAFITYSHIDARAASRLQRSLESYRLPRKVAGSLEPSRVSGRRIGKVFRDREELSAGGDLGQTISKALADSEFLIVVCSPAARKSRWVNLEIEEFRRSHADSRILCYIVAGEPFAANPEEECFPTALGYVDGVEYASANVEPVAADIREGGDGVRLAKLKLISGLLDIGLDKLVQRDTQRRQRNLALVTAASAAGMAAMAILAVAAMDARKAEELRRAEAEDLIEFMLTDLRDRLDDVGRLDVLDAVGEKSIEYYSKVDIEEHSEPSLGRRARAFHLLGEVDDLKGDLESARDAFVEAYQSTGELLARQPDDGERVFNHAQSVFWVGYLAWRLGDYDSAYPAFREYVELAERLVVLDPGSVDWLAEKGHANINLGVYTYETASPGEAVSYFEQARDVFTEASTMDPDSIEWLDLVAQSNAWLADVYESAGELRQAAEHRETEIGIYQRILERDPNNQTVISSTLTAYRAVGRIALDLGDLDSAVRSLSDARRIADDLRRQDPENTLTAQILASAYLSLSEALAYRDGVASTRGLMQTAQQTIDWLLQRDPDVQEWIELHHRFNLVEGKLGLIGNAPTEALPGLSESVTALEAMTAKNPELNRLRELLATARFYRGEVYRQSSDSDQSGAEYLAAIGILSGSDAEISPYSRAILSLAYRKSGNDSAAARLEKQLSGIDFLHPDYTYFR